MSGKVTQHNLFHPTRSKAETKAQITDTTARGIIQAEAEAREAKTARLRKLRLKNEAAAAPPSRSSTPRSSTQGKVARKVTKRKERHD